MSSCEEQNKAKIRGWIRYKSNPWGRAFVPRPNQLSNPQTKCQRTRDKKEIKETTGATKNERQTKRNAFLAPAVDEQLGAGVVFARAPLPDGSDAPPATSRSRRRRAASLRDTTRGRASVALRSSGHPTCTGVFIVGVACSERSCALRPVELPRTTCTTVCAGLRGVPLLCGVSCVCACVCCCCVSSEKSEPQSETSPFSWGLARVPAVRWKAVTVVTLRQR